MENLALATLLIPFAGAAVAAFVSNDRAKWIAQAAAAATLAAVLLLAIEFAAAGKPTHTLDLVTVGSAVLFGVVVDRLSVLVAIAVIGIGLLVCVYSAAYLSPGNREHPARRATPLLLLPARLHRRHGRPGVLLYDARPADLL